MNFTKKICLALALSAVATFAVAEDGSDLFLSSMPNAQQPQHIQIDQFKGAVHLDEQLVTRE